MTSPSLNIESRANISLAVGNYLQAIAQFESASTELANASSELRKHLRTPIRFVTRIDFQHFLVTSHKEGNFEVEQIESL